MEHSKLKKNRRAEKPSFNVTGNLAMPKDILPWERELLTVLLEALNEASEGASSRFSKQKKSCNQTTPGVKS